MVALQGTLFTPSFNPFIFSVGQVHHNSCSHTFPKGMFPTEKFIVLTLVWGERTRVEYHHSFDSPDIFIMENETRNLIEDKFIVIKEKTAFNSSEIVLLTKKGEEEIKRFIRKNPGMFLLIQQFVREKDLPIEVPQEKQ